MLKIGFYDEQRDMPHIIEVFRDDRVIYTQTLPASGGWADAELKIDLPKGETRLLFRGSLPRRQFPIKFPGAVTDQTYSTRFALGIPEITRVD